MLLVCGLVAIGVAAWGEALVQSMRLPRAGVALYLVAIVLFVLTSRATDPLRMQTAANGEAAGARVGISRRLLVPAGLTAAVVLNAGGLLLLSRDLNSAPGDVLWALSVLLVLATAITARGDQGWPARWSAQVWPAERGERVRLVLVIGAILLLAAATRLLFLDSVPQGINADEGDRAAVSIQILRGDNTRGLFDDGWYYVSMFYFWLLAQVMRVVGIGFAQARVFGALAGVATVGVVTWIGARHFSLRVGLLGGSLTALLGVALQFSRETSESGPTALLWAVSVALFLEAARRGRSWAWVGAGVAGGLSVYFYTTGRLWPLFAALWCSYLLAHGLGGRRRDVLRGTVLAALACVLTASPFFLRMSQAPQLFTLRAEQTSIFTADNATRLAYFRPGMTVPELLGEQFAQSLGLFDRVPDGGGFWPTGRPIMSGLLAVLTLVGVGWISARWRDPRSVLLALCFWIGLGSVVVTVETPNLQRMAVAVPMLALPSVLVIDELARRAESAWPKLRMDLGRVAFRPTTAVVCALVGSSMLQQGEFYFGQYARTDPWAYRTLEGEAVNEQGRDTLVLTLGRDFFQINSGWIRLLAPFTPRAGLKSPGGNLPLTIPADTNLAFSLYPKQSAYLPYLQELYPGGAVIPYAHPREGLIVTMYRLSRDDWRATQGAVFHGPDGEPLRVDRIGQPPAGWQAYPATAEWTAGLRVPAYGNYAFRIGPGPSSLMVDDIEVLSAPDGSAMETTTLALAGGDHAIRYVGTMQEPGTPALFQWASVGDSSSGALGRAEWSDIPTELLLAAQSEPMGLLATTQVGGRPEERWVDRALATCCLSQQIRSEGHVPYTVTWSGKLHPPSPGTYTMALWAQGAVDLEIDGKPVLQAELDEDRPATATTELADDQTVELTYRVSQGAGGIEWSWTRPDGVTSIVPPSTLTPSEGAVGPPVSAAALTGLLQPANPFETVK